MPLIKDKEMPKEAAPQTADKPAASKPLTNRNVSEEVRGQVRMHCWIAAMSSPVVAQHFYAQDAKLDEILKMVEETANRGVQYSFGEGA